VRPGGPEQPRLSVVARASSGFAFGHISTEGRRQRCFLQHQHGRAPPSPDASNADRLRRSSRLAYPDGWVTGPSKPVTALDTKLRPVIDADYLTPKTVSFIRQQAAAKKPFFVHPG